MKDQKDGSKYASFKTADAFCEENVPGTFNSAQRAKLSDIDPKQYYLPSTPRELKGLVHYEQKDGFRRFLAELKERDKGMHLLSQYILQAKS